jgi:hypothetical protein
MGLSQYQQTLAALNPDLKRAIEDVFIAWTPDTALAQVSRNVTGETALAADDFSGLLASFATELANGNPAEKSWITACRRHKLKGRQIPNDHCPAVLGRARSLEDHANSVSRASSRSLTAQEAKKQLLKNSGSRNPVGFEPFLRAAVLGNYIVWATFNSDDPRADPFDRLPKTRLGICTALGLGGPMLNETLIVLVWNHADSGSPPLHRPTVADAEDYPYYRPRANAAALWGLTGPLPPNAEAIQPQPEVVMPETASRGLRLPFRVVQV